YERGEGVDQSDAEAYFWYSLAFRRGYGLNLEGFWTNAHAPQDDKLSPEQKASVDKRIAAWRPAREMKLMPNQLGAFEEDDRPPILSQVSRFREMAERGNPYFQAHLASLYYRGAGVPQDKAEAARWYRKAAEQGEYDAIKWLGKMYATGDGVTQDW